MSIIDGSSSREFFILGEDWSLYEDFVPRENFSEEEIRIKHSRRYYSKDGRHIEPFPCSLASRKIAVGDMEHFFSPHLQLTNRVLTCEFINPPDFYRPNSFAWITKDAVGKETAGIYGEHSDGYIENLYGSGVRPLSNFAKSIAIPLSCFCKEYGLILVLHNEYPLDVTDPTELSNPENGEIG